MDSKKALLIVNPCAGRNNKRLGALEIVKKFSPPEWETEIRTTRCQGDATTIVKDEGAKYDVILCCGGDGTLNEVINGLMKLDKKFLSATFRQVQPMTWQTPLEFRPSLVLPPI